MKGKGMGGGGATQTKEGGENENGCAREGAKGLNER